MQGILCKSRLRCSDRDAASISCKTAAHLSHSGCLHILHSQARSGAHVPHARRHLYT